jgi:hypothetical protein
VSGDPSVALDAQPWLGTPVNRDSRCKVEREKIFCIYHETIRCLFAATKEVRWNPIQQYKISLCLTAAGMIRRG